MKHYFIQDEYFIQDVEIKASLLLTRRPLTSSSHLPLDSFFLLFFFVDVDAGALVDELLRHRLALPDVAVRRGDGGQLNVKKNIQVHTFHSNVLTNLLVNRFVG